MFLGKYYHKLEEKGRVSMPKKFREATEEWVVTRGLDGGLFVFTQTDFAENMQSLMTTSFTKKINRDFVRLMANEALTVTTDRNGRIQLPEYLIQFANLENDVVIVGSMTRVEIWNQKKYHQYVDTIEKQAEVIAESIEHHA